MLGLLGVLGIIFLCSWVGAEVIHLALFKH
jgi:hypothetical protein